MDEELADNPDRINADSDDDGDFEAVDYRFLTPVTHKKDYALPSRGEKDFEPDGTNKQVKSLQASRDAMYAALAVERELSGKNYIRATWDAEAAMGRLCARDTRGTMFKSIGRTDREDNTWLLPEELLYMVERGSIECFYQDVEVAMSLQAAYAECIPHIGLDEFQVYAYLKRAGYMVLRASREHRVIPLQQSLRSVLTRRLHAVLDRINTALASATRKTGTIDRHQTYRSFRDVYDRLRFVPYHLPTTTNNLSLSHSTTDNPLKLSFDVWKPNSNFKKSAPGNPHFRMAVLNSRDHGVCSLGEINALFATLVEDETFAEMSQFARLKTGRRSFVLAVADMGVVSFLSLGDVCFGTESVYTEYQPMIVKPRRPHRPAIVVGPAT